MKYFLVLAAVVSFAGLCSAQTAKAEGAHRNADPRCSQLGSSSANTTPSYHGPGFGTVEYSTPDEPFIVPAGCVQFFCAEKRETYRVLSCPNLKAKNSSLVADTKESPAAAHPASGSK